MNGKEASGGCLATGWATVGDLVGADAAREVIAPRVQAQRERWGSEVFAAVKAAHDEQRRRELA